MPVSSDDAPPTVLPNSVVRIDPNTLEPAQVVRVGRQPDLVVVAGGFAWVTRRGRRCRGSALLGNAGERTLTRIDTSTGEAERVYPFDDLDLIAGAGNTRPRDPRRPPDRPDRRRADRRRPHLGRVARAEVPQPDVRIIGVESSGAPAMQASVAAGHLVTLGSVDCSIDGLNVNRVGRHTFDIVCRHGSDGRAGPLLTIWPSRFGRTHSGTAFSIASRPGCGNPHIQRAELFKGDPGFDDLFGTARDEVRTRA